MRTWERSEDATGDAWERARSTSEGSWERMTLLFKIFLGSHKRETGNDTVKETSQVEADILIVITFKKCLPSNVRRFNSLP